MVLKSIETEKDDGLPPINRKTINYLVNHSGGTDYVVKLVKRKTVNDTFTVLRLFEHIGELRFFEFILHKVVKNEGLIYYHNKDTIEEFRKLHDLGVSTLHNYLRTMIHKTILIKIGNGRYKVNGKYVIVTGKRDKYETE